MDLKRYKIDIDKINNLDDIKLVLKYMGLFFTPPPGNENAYDELKHLLVNDEELMTKVLGTRGAIFDKPRYVDAIEGEAVLGDWVVLKGIIYQIDAYFLHTVKDTEGMIKVQKPDWL